MAKAKRKRNAATTHAKVAAGNKPAKPKAIGVQEIPADEIPKSVAPWILLQSQTKNALFLLPVRRGSKVHQKRRR